MENQIKNETQSGSLDLHHDPFEGFLDDDLATFGALRKILKILKILAELYLPKNAQDVHNKSWVNYTGGGNRMSQNKPMFNEDQLPEAFMFCFNQMLEPGLDIQIRMANVANMLLLGHQRLQKLEEYQKSIEKISQIEKATDDFKRGYQEGYREGSLVSLSRRYGR